MKIPCTYIQLLLLSVQLLLLQQLLHLLLLHSLTRSLPKNSTFFPNFKHIRQSQTVSSSKPASVAMRFQWIQSAASKFKALSTRTNG
jgi:hypothetical protein